MAVLALAGSAALAGPRGRAPERALAPAANDQPRVFLLDASALRDARDRVRAADARTLPAWTALETAAGAALSAGPFSVTDKSVVPPSGDKHDYMSQAPYWWPNPATPNGLPYVQRDGERNPEINKIIDHQSMDRMAGAVETLALGAYLSGDDKYARKASQLLRAWFIDPATRMNPNLQYGQGIPGITTGRGIGLIETRGLARVVDAVGLLETTGAWTAGDDQGVKDWFSFCLRKTANASNCSRRPVGDAIERFKHEIDAALSIGKRLQNSLPEFRRCAICGVGFSCRS